MNWIRNKGYGLGVTSLLLRVTCCLLLVILFAGCVSVSTTTKRNLSAHSTYGANSFQYIPLVTLCKQSGINFDYDAFSKTVCLSKNRNTINLMVGESLMALDGAQQCLNYPVRFIQGVPAVPMKFKEEVLNKVFQDAPVSLQLKSIDLKNKTVVIDPGHGGYDPGTIGRSGLREKSVNLDVANRLYKLLKNEGVNVIMTRSTDSFISLEKRVEIANNAGADIFLSIHSNANNKRNLNGFEVYYISSEVSDYTRAIDSAKNSKLNMSESCFAKNNIYLKAILWDMIYSFSRAESVELANAICGEAASGMNVKILGVKGARFAVLRGAQIPAVLVEIGFLSNANEERLLKNSYYRQQVAEAISCGVISYIKTYAFAEASK